MLNKCFVCPLRNYEEKCEHSFEDNEGSDEHILLQSLGGKLKSKNLICTKKNIEFGETYDLEVSDQLKNIRDFMGLKSRSKVKTINLTDTDGKKRPIKAGSYEPIHTIDLYNNDGSLKTTLFFRSDEAFEKQRKVLLDSNEYKEAKDLNETDLLRQFTNKYSEGKKITFQINKYYLLHFVKVAIEYYLDEGFPIEFIQGCIENFNKEIVTDGKSPRVFEYHPSQKIYTPSEKEVSHIIHLKIDSKNHLIYCMIEYFNFTRTVVILNDNYKGELHEIRNYCYDLISKKNIEIAESEIDLEFNNFNLREFRRVYSEKNTAVHTDRFNRMWETICYDLINKGHIKKLEDNKKYKTN